MSDPHDGKDVIVVPLQASWGCARLFEEDFQRLIDAGLSPFWSYNSNGGGVSYVRASLSGGRCGEQVSLARLVAGAKKGQRVRYRDRDPRNLRSDNLYIERGYSRRHDRALVAVRPSLNAAATTAPAREEAPTSKVVARAPSAPFTFA
jgi:hypothetical protein